RSADLGPGRSEPRLRLRRRGPRLGRAGRLPRRRLGARRRTGSGHRGSVDDRLPRIARRAAVDRPRRQARRAAARAGDRRPAPRDARTARPDDTARRGAGVTGTAILSDLDGVLVDSAAAIERAWRRWAGRWGLDADEVVRAGTGVRSIDVVRRFAPEADPDA